jgi:hypothetical protein
MTIPTIAGLWCGNSYLVMDPDGAGFLCIPDGLKAMPVRRAQPELGIVLELPSGEKRLWMTPNPVLYDALVRRLWEWLAELSGLMFEAPIDGPLERALAINYTVDFLLCPTSLMARGYQNCPELRKALKGWLRQHLRSTSLPREAGPYDKKLAREVDAIP